MRAFDNFFNQIMQSQILRFLIVGSLGFVIDASILHIAHLKFSLIISRLISFPVAVTCTWLLNRLFTFKSNDPNYKSEWTRYTLINTTGGIINFFGFILLIHHLPTLRNSPVLALGIATITSAVFNFYFSRRFAFRNLNAHELADNM